MVVRVQILPPNSETFHDVATLQIRQLPRRIFHIRSRVDTEGILDALRYPDRLLFLRIVQKPDAVRGDQGLSVFVKEQAVSHSEDTLKLPAPGLHQNLLAQLRQPSNFNLPGGEEPRQMLLCKISPPDAEPVSMELGGILKVVDECREGQSPALIRLAVANNGWKCLDHSDWSAFMESSSRRSALIL